MLDLSKASNHELAILAHFGDEEGSTHLWERLSDLAGRIAMSFRNKYPWIDAQDLKQSILLTYPKIVNRFDHTKVKFDKYVAISFYRAAQDELRKEDPLGIGIPQKSKYPKYAHLSDFWDGTEEDDFSLDGFISDGIKRLDKGYVCSRE